MENPDYSKQTAKFIATLIQAFPAISSQGMQFWIENPGVLGEVLRNDFTVYPNHIPLFTLTTGNFTNEELLEKLKESGCVDEDNLKGFAFRLSKTPVEEKQEVDVVCIRTAKHPLHGKSESLTARYFTALGYECLTAELSVLLALALKNDSDPDLPKSFLAIDGSGNDWISNAYVREDGEFKISGRYARRMENYENLIFVKPRK